MWKPINKPCFRGYTETGSVTYTNASKFDKVSSGSNLL